MRRLFEGALLGGVIRTDDAKRSPRPSARSRSSARAVADSRWRSLPPPARAPFFPHRVFDRRQGRRRSFSCEDAFLSVVYHTPRPISSKSRTSLLKKTPKTNCPRKHPALYGRNGIFCANAIRYGRCLSRPHARCTARSFAPAQLPRKRDDAAKDFSSPPPVHAAYGGVLPDKSAVKNDTSFTALLSCILLSLIRSGSDTFPPF